MRKICLILCAWMAAVMPVSLSAQNVGVASSADPRATEAGMEMLRRGGSAADAAMAMMLTLTVVEPQSSGIGGGGFLVYQDRETGNLSTINGRETAPAAAKPERFLGADGKPKPFIQSVLGGQSVGVPGNIALMAMTHAKWGKLDWAEIFEPAIRVAEEGFVVNETLSLRLRQLERFWGEFPEAQKLYWVDGKPAPVGTLVKNPAMAKTLRDIAQNGPEAFYKGEIAANIVAVAAGSHINPSDMTLQDLADYKAEEQSALCAPYRVYIVCGMAPPSSGATTILQMLGMLQHFDMAALGKDDPKAWHLIGEAMQLAYADREKYLADTDFVKVPVKGLVDPDYLTARAALIDPDHAAGTYEAGLPPGAEPRTAAISGEVSGTSHFVAVDAAGNIATMTSTIEGPFGSQLIANGFFLNNELTDFTHAPEKDGMPVANRVEGGKRPLSSMSPTIVYDAAGKPVLALGSAGGKRIIMHVAKTLIGVLDFGLPVDQAIALPNIYFGGGSLQVEGDTYLAAMSEQLAAFGQPVLVSDLGSKVNAAQYQEHGWIGAADPRSEGTAQVE